MCGITGAISLRNRSINTSVSKKMLDKIKHRGPDDSGYLFFHTGTKTNKSISFFQNYTDKEFKQNNSELNIIDAKETEKELSYNDYDLFMGHRRLSILDITNAGHQPMSDMSKNIWIVYNGEIYNFKDIKKELIDKGYSFKNNTDTEVIIYSYLEWGIKCLNKFNGMFSFGLYDNIKRKFFLCRDRYGIKPLYYTTNTKDQSLVFASEIKSILEYSEYSPLIDKEALLEYFTFQNIFTDKTLHKEIKLLEAGTFLEIDLKSNNIIKEQYWDFDFSNSLKVKDEREYIEELDRLFNQAVNRQLISDVPLGSYLSGGIDSGSITAIASKKLPFMNTFTIGFDLNSASGMELDFDERSKSEFMSYLFKTEHYEMVLKSGDMERCLPEFSYHLEEPRVGQSYPNYYAAKLSSKFVKVVLSGAGGDELFAGYPWRYYRAVNNNSFEDYIDKYYLFWQRLIPNKEIKEVFSPIYNDIKHIWTRDIFSNVFKKHSEKLTRPEDYINHSLYFEAKTFLHGLLVVEDKLSMAHSLETRVPFLDNDLVDFAQKIPSNLKLKNLDNVVRLNENESGPKTSRYFQKTHDGKLIFRKLMEKYIPNEITGATKQGFSSPDNSWFKGESIEFVRKKLLNSNAQIYNYFDKKSTEKLINEHLSGSQNRRLFIWSLLNFEEFCNQYNIKG